jgi:hypothetical protein
MQHKVKTSSFRDCDIQLKCCLCFKESRCLGIVDRAFHTGEVIKILRSRQATAHAVLWIEEPVWARIYTSTHLNIDN